MACALEPVWTFWAAQPSAPRTWLFVWGGWGGYPRYEALDSGSTNRAGRANPPSTKLKARHLWAQKSQTIHPVRRQGLDSRPPEKKKPISQVRIRRLQNAPKSAERRHLGEWGTHVVWASHSFKGRRSVFLGALRAKWGIGIGS